MKTDRTYLLHIRDAIGRIEECSAAGRAEFFATPHWQDAIIRQLEIIGEASQRLSSDLRETTPEIPWRRICGLRVLIHHYMGVDLEAVWAVVETGIPALKESVEGMLSKQ
ncbi:MAG TPA: DUF86 domain-containing protein [Bryobacteraceae bacterium]|nr:DUF86 domain-containing protein [Bryobacteraceae bacterium]